MDVLIDRVARIPQPARANWTRKSIPEWEAETLETPIVTKPLTRPRLKKAELVELRPRIARVTVCMSGNEQHVNAYDENGSRIDEYCGWFREVGLKVLTVAGHLRWEMVAESA